MSDFKRFKLKIDDFLFVLCADDETKEAVLFRIDKDKNVHYDADIELKNNTDYDLQDGINCDVSDMVRAWGTRVLQNYKFFAPSNWTHEFLMEYARQDGLDTKETV